MIIYGVTAMQIDILPASQNGCKVQT